MNMESDTCPSSSRNSSKKVKKLKIRKPKEPNEELTNNKVIGKRKLDTDKPNKSESGKKQRSHEKMKSDVLSSEFAVKNSVKEASCKNKYNFVKNINKANITVNAHVGVGIDEEIMQPKITSKVPDINNAESCKSNLASLDNHNSKFATSSKHIHFDDDEDQSYSASCSTDTKYNNKNKKSNKQKHKISSESRTIIREEDIKDEDIDEYCDDLDEESNNVYENWIKLLEKKLGPCNKDNNI